jgi:arginyl-tRNA synthetase
MLKEVRSLLSMSISSLAEDDKLLSGCNPVFHVDHIRKKGHGDIASNIALVLSKPLATSPLALAKRIVDRIPSSAFVDHVEIAGPGFINFFLNFKAWSQVIRDIRSSGESYGCSKEGLGQRVLIEFVSSNPTGPLHVGHGRGAAYGDALSRVLQAVGYTTESEYYINDAGRQTDILALSVWLRYLELCGEMVQFPDGAYQGNYILEIAESLGKEDGNAHHHSPDRIMASLPNETDAQIDLLISRMKECIQKESFSRIQSLAINSLVSGIKEDLSQFNVNFDTWYSENSLVQSGALETMVTRLKNGGFLYEKDGAWWFRSSDLGDAKDRVVIRANGSHTYFATDIAYHMEKLDRGFDQLINVWGSDHHGYISRMKAAIAALDRNPNDLTVLTVQFAALYRDGEKVSMSTRSGEFITMRELFEEVGLDAARFFYVLRKPEQHMDFDLDLAKTQSNDNPVYYVQYAHARICSVFRQLQERGIPFDLHDADISVLSEVQELDLLRSLSRYPDVVGQAARKYEPHQIAYFARELANDFHAYYNAYPFINSEDSLRLARLLLIDATRQILANALKLLGVSAPTTM